MLLTSTNVVYSARLLKIFNFFVYQGIETLKTFMNRSFTFLSEFQIKHEDIWCLRYNNLRLTKWLAWAFCLIHVQCFDFNVTDRFKKKTVQSGFFAWAGTLVPPWNDMII